MNELWSVSFLNENKGTVVGGNGIILTTTNGGTNWISQSSGTSNWLDDVSFIDVNNGIAVGDGGKAFITADGGSNWEDISFKSKDANVALVDVFYLAAGKYLAVGEDMLIITSK